MKIKPSAKEKIRYVLFDVYYIDNGKIKPFIIDNIEAKKQTAEKVEKNQEKQDLAGILIKNLISAYIYYYGLIDYTSSSLYFMKEKFLKNYGIAKIRRDRVDRLKALFALYTKSIGKNKVVIKSIKTFGTLKKVKSFLKGEENANNKSSINGI